MDEILTSPVILWERQGGEPSRWYARFYYYYLPLGGERTIEQAFRDWYATKQNKANLSNSRQKRPSVTWYDTAKAWQWKERAEAWDREQSRLQALAEEAERLEWQKNRRSIMTAYFGKLANALKDFDFTEGNLSLGAITAAVKMVLEQNRLEYGLPTEISKVDQSIDVEWQESNET